jgi:peptidoglycan hydrolase-like protein with peptidoglycan-binding domain
METLAYVHLTLTQEQHTPSSQQIPPFQPGQREYSTSPSLSFNLLPIILGILMTGFTGFSAEIVLAQGVLRLGSEGTDVAAIQDRLASLGYFTASSTGFYGPITEDAISRYQADQGLQVDGIAGPQTLAVLLGTSTAANTDPTATTSTSDSATVDLQDDLAGLGYYQGGIDGLYGPLTEEAVRSFQASYGLPITGIVDVATLNALESALILASSTPEATTPAAPVSAPVPITTSPEGSTVVVEEEGVLVQQGTDSTRIVVSQDPDRTFVETISSNDPLTLVAPPSSGNELTSIPPSDPFSSSSAFISTTDRVPVAQLYPNTVEQIYPTANTTNTNTTNNRGFASSASINAPTVISDINQGYAPYVVAVPDRATNTLTTVQQYSPYASLAGSSRGAYINAGSYIRREDAEHFSQMLREQGIDARVVYEPR